jgi:hypothetical protein
MALSIGSQESFEERSGPFPAHNKPVFAPGEPFPGRFLFPGASRFAPWTAPAGLSSLFLLLVPAAIEVIGADVVPGV